MKICLTVNSSPWTNLKGGGNIAVHYLALALVKFGHDVTVIFSKKPGDVVNEKVPYRIAWARHYDVATINLNIFSYYSTFQKLLKEHKFDIVHGNGEEAFCVSATCYNRNIPFVYTSHANLLPRLGMFEGMLHPIQFLKSVNQHLQRATALNARRIMVFSKFSSGLVSGALGSECPPIDVVPPGIDPAWLEVVPEPDTSPVILVWGRMEEQKGIPDLLQAYKQVYAQKPEVRLWIVGEGNFFKQYNVLAKSLGLTSSVEFFGWQSVESIRKLAERATACVFPSRVESFGLAMAEGLATGVPVIATRVGALPELIDSGATGTLVPAHDIPALTDAMLQILNDPARFQKQGQRGRQSVLKRFSWDKAGERISAIYQDLIGNSRVPGLDIP